MEAPGHVPSVPSPKSGAVQPPQIRRNRATLQDYKKAQHLTDHICSHQGDPT